MIAIFVILAATMVSLGRLLTPYLNEHRTEFEQWASQLLQSPVTIDEIHISWDMYLPQLTLDKVTIKDTETKKSTFEIEQVTINLNIWDSLIRWEPVLSYIKISGLNVTIKAEKSGEVSVPGLGQIAVMDNFTGAREEANDIAAWIFAQPALVLDNIDIKFIAKNGDISLITLDELILRNSKSKHLLKGKAILHQDIPMTVSLGLEWDGATFDPAVISARLYLYLEAFSLPQWLHKQTWNHLQIKEGLGSAKVWVEWDKGDFQKIQTQFQIYALELFSDITKKSKVITRLNGHVGWKRDKDKQIFSGEDILIDLPEHLWPTTHFYVSLPLAAENTAYKVRTGFVNLQDSYDFLMASGLLSTDFEKILTTIKPKGIIHSLDAEVSDFKQWENNRFSSDFSNLSFNSWENYPSLARLTGALSWNGKEGDLLLDSKETTILIPSLFVKPMLFEELTGSLKVNKDANKWKFTSKNVFAKNEDLEFNTKLTMSLAEKELPVIDLISEFSIKRAENIKNYIPSKVMDPDLVKWLNQAFNDGQFDSGKLIMQGDMNDFPFANGLGQFMFSAHAKELDFNYGINWPAIKRLDGTLQFAGHTMQVNIDKGILLDIPIEQIRGEIPYIGPHQPQVLTIEGIINGDLLQGLKFIQQSPLHEKLGKELEGMHFTGPMQLRLGLLIPVKKPENTKVNGDILFPNADLTMQNWDFALKQLKGTIHFTENDLSSSALNGTLFDEPAILDITTEHPENAAPFVKMSLKSKLPADVLQSWLGAEPKTQMIEGSTDFNANLTLVSSEQTEPSQLIINSDLTGLALNLPDGLAKKADEELPSQLVLNFKQNKPLQLKFNLGKTLSAAATLQNKKNQWQLYSGELRMGGTGVANWQTQAGILLSGQFDTLDLNAWETYFPKWSWANLKNMSSTQSNEAFNLNMLRAIDISANKIMGIPVALSKARIQISQSGSQWSADVNSKEAVGQIVFPKASSQSIKARFKYLYLMPLDNKKNDDINPKSIPGISFIGEDVRYKDARLGRIAFDLFPTSSGLKISSLKVSTSFYTFNAAGDWVAQKNKSQTRLKGSLTTKNVAEFISYWGSPSENPVGSSGAATFDLTWPGAPYNPSLPGMFGEATLKLSPGSIINLDKSTNAKMGFGRMLNILSIESLSRRLSLNFSDLNQKGYTFDSMRGSFSLKNGNAYTDDTSVEGSIAQIELAGRIGLVAKDYNLTLSVTPHVTGSIPVVAALAVNPIVGVAAWAVEKVASSAVSSATTSRYSITGPWDKPVWKEK